MSRVVVANFSVSIDGYGAGPDQSQSAPLGVGGDALHTWQMGTRAFKEIHGEPGGTDGVDSALVARFTQDVGAFIVGRNMFGPVRGDWPEDDWNGWWGDNPPFHAPTFILTHHPRPSVAMKGGTTYHFVTDGIEAALEQAKAAADGKNVTIGGGVATIRQYLRAGLIDEVHFAIVPVILGRGEAVFEGLDLPALRYRVTRRVATEAATHIILARHA